MKTPTAVRQNIRDARRLWPRLPRRSFSALKSLTLEHGISVALGDLHYMEGKWYVSHSGLLRIARRNGCYAMGVEPVPEFCDSGASRWTFKANIRKSPTCPGFVGYGDADPSNVSPLVHGAEMRVAETRAVNRALRKAYGIGICSVEELGSRSAPPVAKPNKVPPESSNGDQGAVPKLRDRLCVLIRQHRLEGGLVKRYAADFCGVTDLRQASREQVERFVSHLAEAAAQDRIGLLARLDQYREREPGAA